MTKKQILEGNKAIALFMEFTLSDVNPNILSVPKGEELKYQAFHTNINKMPYNSSWDWLMPVLIKMVSKEEYNEFRSGYGWPYIEGNPLSCFSTTEEYDVNLTIDIIYKEVIKFIKWYNHKNLANVVMQLLEDFKKRTYRSRKNCIHYYIIEEGHYETLLVKSGCNVDADDCIGVNCGYYKTK